MNKYEFDEETGGLLLVEQEDRFSKEPRPVYAKELDILGFDKHWRYESQNETPYLWAEASNYFYRGKKIATIKGGSLYEKPALTVVEDSGVPEGAELLPIDIARMVEKNLDAMSTLQQFTLKRIYNYWRRWKSKLDCFHVAFSGGKDSVVLLDLVKRALPKSEFVVVFGDTGMEFPDTYQIVAQVEAQCKSEGINFYRAQSYLQPEESWKIFGPPSSVLRWCCSVHKAAPQTLKLREVLGKNNFIGADFVGVRAHESLSRAGYDIENFGRKQKGQHSHNSILEWNSAEIWNYIFMRGLPINDAYKEGNSRVGCLFCPMTSGKAVFFRRNSFPNEVEKFIGLIKDSVSDENVDSYVANGGWVNRKTGRDLIHALTNYSEEKFGDYLYITVKNPASDWREWIKTLGEIPFAYDMREIEDGYVVKVHSRYDKTPAMKNFKYVFHKAAACVGCGVCEANCRFGAISFTDGLKIQNCVHCQECHKIDRGCERYNSTKFFISERCLMKTLNTFADHAPKAEWLKNFFEAADSFFENSRLGPNQLVYFKRFLFDAGLLDRKTKKVTDFAQLIKKIGWDSADAWGLILVNLVYNNPQIRWYVENMPIDETFPRQEIEENLKMLEISEKDSKSIVKAFKRLCETPLGTVLNFGKTNGRNIETLTRTKAKILDGKVLLYALFKFAEAGDGARQFNLTRLMNTDIKIENAELTPARIFGVTRGEMARFLNGLSINHPRFINVSFTHDLEKISLSEEKTAAEVLSLFG